MWAYTTLSKSIIEYFLIWVSKLFQDESWFCYFTLNQFIIIIISWNNAIIRTSVGIFAWAWQKILHNNCHIANKFVVPQSISFFFSNIFLNIIYDIIVWIPFDFYFNNNANANLTHLSHYLMRRSTTDYPCGGHFS